MTRVSSLTVLNVVQENRKMVTKVVGYKRLKRVIYMSREEKKEFPTFSGFVKFFATYIHTYKLYLTTLASSAKFAGFHKGREKQNIFTSKKNTKRV